MLRYLVDPIFQVINTAGKPATGGYVEVYLHGTRDKYYCASDFEGTLHPFKIPLDSLGANIILADDANAYDIYVYNRYGSLLMSRYNVFPVQVGVSPYDLKTLTLKKGNRVLGTYSPLEQKSIDVSEIVFLDEQNQNLYQAITQSLLSDMVPVLTKSNLDPNVPGGVSRDYYYYPTSRTGVDGDYSFIGYDDGRFEIATVHEDNSVTYNIKSSGIHRIAKKYVEVNGEYVMTLGDGDRCSEAEPDGETVTKSDLLAWLDAGETLIFSYYGFGNYQKRWGIAEDVRVYGEGSSRTVNAYFSVRTDNVYILERWYIYTTSDSEFVTLQQGTSIVNEATANKVQTLDDTSSHYPSCPAVKNAIETALSSAYHAAGTKTVSQLTSSLLVAANQGNVYNVTDSGTTTADFVEGAGHPIAAGDNVGICDVGGGVYKFDLLSGFVDLSGYLAKTGDGSDVTASFTVASTRTNLTTGEKLSILFGKIAKWFSDLKTVAFTGSYNDLLDKPNLADKQKVITIVQGAPIILDANGNMDLKISDGSFLDDLPYLEQIGDKQYKVGLMPDGKVWMCENLDYGSSGVYYNNDEPTYGWNGLKYGKLYTWDEAIAAGNSISGWHLPTAAEWDALAAAVGGVDVAGTKLKSSTGWESGNGDDSYGFAVFPAGRLSSGSFINLGNSSNLWTANEYTSTFAYRRYFTTNEPMYLGYDYKTDAFSVRLVKD